MKKTIVEKSIRSMDNKMVITVKHDESKFVNGVKWVPEVGMYKHIHEEWKTLDNILNLFERLTKHTNMAGRFVGLTESEILDAKIMAAIDLYLQGVCKFHVSYPWYEIYNINGKDYVRILAYGERKEGYSGMLPYYGISVLEQ